MSLIFRYVHYPRHNLCFCFFLLAGRGCKAQPRGGEGKDLCVFRVRFVIMEEERKIQEKERKKKFITDYSASLFSASFLLFFYFRERDNRDFFRDSRVDGEEEVTRREHG